MRGCCMQVTCMEGGECTGANPSISRYGREQLRYFTNFTLGKYNGNNTTFHACSVCTVKRLELLSQNVELDFSCRVLRLLFTRTQSMVRQQAQAEKLTLLVADNKAGYFGVTLNPGLFKPYEAQVWRGGKDVY